uniref:Reverse transcriptase domain-containing protein n=1 Tax=Amphimedon queenslandica TaxID=400682 RepID=A0A1X7SIR3_AMPQE
HCCFHRLPFGITSASEHCNQRISDILTGAQGVVSMTDDILVFGKDQDEHGVHLWEALRQIEETGSNGDSTGIHPDPDCMSLVWVDR